MKSTDFVADSLRRAVDAALADDWDLAHQIAQDSSHSLANWLHAVLHKIEGDAWNSRYWYARTDKKFEDFDDHRAELIAIAVELSKLNRQAPTTPL